MLWDSNERGSYLISSGIETGAKLRDWTTRKTYGLAGKNNLAGRPHALVLFTKYTTCHPINYYYSRPLCWPWPPSLLSVSSRAVRPPCPFFTPLTSSFLPGFHRSAPRSALSRFNMPAMSPTMSEGGIAAWKKNEGEAFASGDVLLEIVSPFFPCRRVLDAIPPRKPTRQQSTSKPRTTVFLPRSL